jgi:fluoride exporter
MDDPISMTKILIVTAGGGMGALSRYAAGILAARLFGPAFPWGTLIVNLSGCFLIGLAFGFAEMRRFGAPSLWLLFVTGYLGALTTFSSFALENVQVFRTGSGRVTAGNLLFNNLCGLALVCIGVWLAQK